jgi:hypothetical protein
MRDFTEHLWSFYSTIVCAVSSSCLSSTHLYRGGPLERGLQRVISDAPMGSLLVQSDAKSGEPLLLHVMLPVCIRERHLAKDTWVFLLDAQVRSLQWLELKSSPIILTISIDRHCRFRLYGNTCSSRSWNPAGPSHLRHISCCSRWGHNDASSRISTCQSRLWCC